MSEIWKPIAGFVGLYKVSNLGRVRRCGRAQGAVVGRIITPKKKHNGYLHLDLSKADKKKRRLIHQLVAEAFLSTKPTLKHVINHIDANKTNNNASNLEWVTLAENNAHARKLGLVKKLPGELNGRSVLTKEDVAEISRMKGVVGQRTIAELFGVSRSTIQWIHQGKRWADLRVREMPRDIQGVK